MPEDVPKPSDADPLTTLGLTPQMLRDGDPAKVLKKAQRKMAMKYHSDKNPEATPEQKARLDELTKYINAAFDMASKDPQKYMEEVPLRARYQTSPRAPTASSSAPSSSAPFSNSAPSSSAPSSSAPFEEPAYKPTYRNRGLSRDPSWAPQRPAPFASASQSRPMSDLEVSNEVATFLNTTGMYQQRMQQAWKGLPKDDQKRIAELLRKRSMGR